jgi:tRNA(Ile)-lysidine synthase
MAARRLRHEFLARTARQHRVKAIALAHHADDQVELFFLRLLRGAGGSGLGGMQWRSPSPVDAGISLVRPVLDVPRAALEEFAREHRIRYREDATNFSLDFLRNRIRRELLPLLRRNYQPGLNRTILRSMEIAGAESNLIAELAGAWLAQREFWHGTQKKDRARSSYVESDFEELPEAIQRQIVKLQIIELGITPDFELIESIRQSPGKPVAVGPDFSLSRDAEGQVSRCRPPAPAFNGHNLAVKVNGPGQIVFDGVELEWRFRKPPKHFGQAGKPAGVEFFDADKIAKEIVLRYWRAGDRFQPIGLKAAVKLQDLFTNAKVPRECRHQLVVAEAAGDIFWVEGLRISENFKLTQQTKRVLVWKWRRHEEHRVLATS